MVIQHNLSAMNAWRQTGINNKSASKSLEKLSSGFKINRAADDAAGLAISEKMRGQIRGLSMGETNTQNGVNLIQTAEGGMEEIVSMLHRMRELSVQASNGTYHDNDRLMIEREVNQLNNEITAMASKTQYNNIPVLSNLLGRVEPSSDEYSYPMPAISGRMLNPGNDLGAFGFDTKTSLIDSQGNSSGVVNFAEKCEGMWNPGDTVEFDLGFNIGVDPTRGQWWDSSNYYSIPQTMNPGQTYAPAFSSVPSIPTVSGTPVGLNPSWELVSSATANVYPDIIIQSPGYPTAPNSFEVTWNGSNLPAPEFVVTGGTMPEGFEIGIKPPFPPSNNNDIGHVNLEVYVVGEFLHSGTSIEPDKGLNEFTLPSYDGNWNVQIINNSPQTLNSGDAVYQAYRYEQTTPGNWTRVAMPGMTISSAPYDITHHRSNVTSATSSFSIAKERPEELLWIQSGANKGEGMGINLYDCRASALGLADRWGYPTISVRTIEDANKSIDRLDNALITMLKNRSLAGAQQNRLEHTLNNLGNTKENLQAAESSIRDVDMAKEMMNFTKNNILAQAAQSMLAQANQLPQGVLSLLR